MVYSIKDITVIFLIALSVFMMDASLWARDIINHGTKEEKAVTLANTEMFAIRLNHAKELLGKHYNYSVVRHGESQESLKDFVKETVRSAISSKWKNYADSVAVTIRKESFRHGFDPLFVMSVIAGESSFNPAAKGPFGEIGLMQLRPETAKWIAEKFNIPFKGITTLKNPIMNIRIGTAYLSYLRKKWNSHAQLYLAAYNMGPRNVKRALNKQVWPKDYPRHVMKRYVAFYEDLKESQI